VEGVGRTSEVGHSVVRRGISRRGVIACNTVGTAGDSVKLKQFLAAPTDGRRMSSGWPLRHFVPWAQASHVMARSPSRPQATMVVAARRHRVLALVPLSSAEGMSL
jgi:hypothetical protein